MKKLYINPQVDSVLVRPITQLLADSNNPGGGNLIDESNEPDISAPARKLYCN